jgi:peptidoglycan/xylan/chitin deacetylase (PgdA/CDA1 family)
MILVSSWDDGNPLDQRLGELLQRYGFKGTFFVPVHNSYGSTVMSPEAMRTLAEWHEIGSHTLDHVYLRGLTPDQVRHQVHEGRDRLQGILGRSVAGFCYPGGRYNRTTIEVVREAGFRYARSVENLVTSAPVDAYQVATTLQIYPHSLTVLANNLLRYPNRIEKSALLRRLAAADGLEERLQIAARYAHERSGVLHIWGHSWELESCELWGTLERFLQWVRDLAPRPMALADLVEAIG